MQDTYIERQRMDTLWPLLLMTIIMIINWWVYIRNGYPDFSFLYISITTGGILCLFWLIQTLKTEISTDQIRFRLFPFQSKWQCISRSEIESLEVRTYNPFKEYGGYGKRSGSSGKAFTISGKYGLQIVLKGGSKILIGTHQQEKLKDFIQRVYTNKLV